MAMKPEFHETSCFLSAPDITVSIIDGEAALLNVRTGAYFGLNKVGTFIWQAYAEGKTFGEVVPVVCREFSVDASVAVTDARVFTQKMLDRGLLRVR